MTRGHGNASAVRTRPARSQINKALRNALESLVIPQAWATVHLRFTHVQEQRQASDPLHGQDEEGDHWEAPAVWVALQPGQYLFESRILGTAESKKAESEEQGRKREGL